MDSESRKKNKIPRDSQHGNEREKKGEFSLSHVPHYTLSMFLLFKGDFITTKYVGPPIGLHTMAAEDALFASVRYEQV